MVGCFIILISENLAVKSIATISKEKTPKYD